jgi:hypothetical protein
VYVNCVWMERFWKKKNMGFGWNVKYLHAGMAGNALFGRWPMRDRFYRSNKSLTNGTCEEVEYETTSFFLIVEIYAPWLAAMHPRGRGNPEDMKNACCSKTRMIKCLSIQRS